MLLCYCQCMSKIKKEGLTCLPDVFPIALKGYTVYGACMNSLFYKEKKVPNPLEASTEVLKNCFCIKNGFEPFSRGLPGVGNLLFFIKYAFLKQYQCTFHVSILWK